MMVKLNHISTNKTLMKDRQQEPLLLVSSGLNTADKVKSKVKNIRQEFQEWGEMTGITLHAFSDGNISAMSEHLLLHREFSWVKAAVWPIKLWCWGEYMNELDWNSEIWQSGWFTCLSVHFLTVSVTVPRQTNQGCRVVFQTISMRFQEKRSLLSRKSVFTVQSQL